MDRVECQEFGGTSENSSELANPTIGDKMECKHPEIEVQLTGEDGNAFFILGKVKKALKRAGHNEDAEEFYKEATSGDYNNLLATCTNYVTVL